MVRWLFAHTVACLCLLVACDSKPAPDAKSQPPSAEPGQRGDPPPSRHVARDLYGTAAIHGRVVLADPPKPASGYLMSGDVFCAKVGKRQPTMPQGRRVGEGGALPYGFVYIKSGIDGAYTTRSEPVILDQSNCRYEPHVFGLMINQPLQIRNSDPTAHNIHAQSQKNDSFNLAQAQQGATATRVFSRPEIMVRFKCDVHSWMEAYAGVLAHPFFTVSDPSGLYKIERLPAGEYVVEVWHEVWGKRQHSVTLGDGQKLEVSFSFARQP